MIDVKKENYCLSSLYVLDTESSYVEKSNDLKLILPLVSLNELDLEDYQCRYWIIDASEYPTYAATTLKTVFPQVSNKRLVLVSPDYKELYKDRSYCSVNGTVYDYRDGLRLKGICMLRDFLQPDEIQYSYNADEIKDLAKNFNSRMQSRIENPSRELAVQSALNTLMFQIASMTEPDMFENTMTASMIDLHDILESMLETRGVSLQRIHKEK